MDMERAKSATEGLVRRPVQRLPGEGQHQMLGPGGLDFFQLGCCRRSEINPADHGAQAWGQWLNFNVAPGRLGDGFAHGSPSLISLP